MKKTGILILAMILLLTAGCFDKNKREKLAPELAAEAMKDFDKERYNMAIESFNKLLEWYPFDKLATLAEFKIAEAHFKMDEFEEAIIAYEEFEKLHPRNEAIPYVLNQIALCYYNRIDTVDRDQNSTRAAMHAFERVVRRFPDSEYAREAGEKRIECLKSLAGQEIYIGRFYYKSKHYKGAIARFQAVLDEYPGLGFDDEAREYIGKCHEKMLALEASGKEKPKEIFVMPE